MKIIDRPSFEILTPESEIQRLLGVIERAGRTSYQSFKGEITPDSSAKFVRMLRSKPHDSVLEHSSMTVAFYGVSRGLTHELVRHRLAGYTQESTRYVDYVRGENSPDLERFQMEAVLPPHRNINQRIDLGDGRVMSPAEMLGEEERFYRALRKAGWVPEDARQVLPTALVSDIVMTANFREWRHVFGLRTAKTAHWEIRRLMNGLLVEMKRIIPPVFEDFVQAGVDKNGLEYFEIRKPNG